MHFHLFNYIFDHIQLGFPILVIKLNLIQFETITYLELYYISIGVFIDSWLYGPTRPIHALSRSLAGDDSKAGLPSTKVISDASLFYTALGHQGFGNRMLQNKKSCSKTC